MTILILIRDYEIIREDSFISPRDNEPMKTTYKTSGTCSTQISVEVDDGIVIDVSFEGGCDGNLQGISSLVVGMKATDVIERLEGTDCDSRGTSCPDQLAKALRGNISA